MTDQWPLAPPGTADWLRDLCGDGLTGFLPPALPDAAWVLNAMYEHEDLAEHRPASPDTSCCPAVRGFLDLETLVVRAGRLGDAEALYDHPEVDFSPSNLWPVDRSRCLATDYDLWGTKVAGPTALIETLLSDPELEAVQLDPN